MSNEMKEGRRRLTLLLCGTSGAGCAVAMLLLLIVYGAPYEAYWWAVMGVILAAAFVLPRFLVPLIEWVIDGYRQTGGN